MIGRRYFGVYPANPAVFIDKIADSAGIDGGFVRAGAIGHPDRPVGIAEQRKREIEFFSEGGVGLNVVETHAENYDVGFLEGFILVAEPATFDSSTRRVSFGIEPQQNLVPAQRGQ
jgi:hypothetical protein